MLLHNTLQREEIDPADKMSDGTSRDAWSCSEAFITRRFQFFFLGQNDSYSDAVMKQNHKHWCMFKQSVVWFIKKCLVAESVHSAACLHVWFRGKA